MLPADLAADLDARGLSYCLIGATALSVHGFARYTADIDLLTLERRVLSPAYWSGTTRVPEIRRGDADDPLEGVVRWDLATPVDLIIGKGYAARLAVETATAQEGVACRVATALALSLLKLEAGSPQDQADILSLATVRSELDGAPWLDEIAAHVPRLSKPARAAWRVLAPEIERLRSHAD